LPRRYRPPAKRRKSRELSVRDVASPLPEVETVPDSTPGAASAPTLTALRQTEVRHVTRDYSYVMGELRRIVLLVAFIVVSLMLTAVFLRWT